jgi:type II secretory pathway pseudopilin PulG
MFLLEIGVIGIVAASALLLVTRPLVRGARVADETLEAERAELEALKEAKYREIRDA